MNKMLINLWNPALALFAFFGVAGGVLVYFRKRRAIQPNNEGLNDGDEDDGRGDNEIVEDDTLVEVDELDYDSDCSYEDLDEEPLD